MEWVPNNYLNKKEDQHKKFHGDRPSGHCQLLSEHMLELIWNTRDENGSQVPRGTRSCNNGMIQPCDYVLRIQSGLLCS